MRYLDHAACTPPWPEALAAQAAAARNFFANPSARHAAGAAARGELRRLKQRFCDLVGFPDGRLVLTSGGTEALNLVLRSVLAEPGDKRLAISADAHAAAWWPVASHKDRTLVLPLDGQGRLPMKRLDLLLTPKVGVVCLPHAANETGIVHDLAAVARLAQARGLRVIADGVQALGHLPVDLAHLEVDAYVFSAHKFGGPRGVGGVLLRGPALAPLQRGGSQEWNMRAGTEDLPGLAGAVAALECSLRDLDATTARLRALAVELAGRIQAARPDALLNGDPATGLPGLVSMSFPGLDGHALATELDLRGWCVGTGSACHADVVEPSRVILALGRTPEQALGTVRLSLGRDADAALVAEVATALLDAVERQARLR